MCREEILTFWIGVPTALEYFWLSSYKSEKTIVSPQPVRDKFNPFKKPDDACLPLINA
jgi:hypothetical protein